MESHFIVPTVGRLSLSLKLKHQFVPDHKGWMLERSLGNVPEASAINPILVSLACVPCAWVADFNLSAQAVISASDSADFWTLAGRISKDSGVFSVFMYDFFPVLTCHISM